MEKFIAIYKDTPESAARFAQATPEQKMEGMKAWMSWKAKNEKHIVDFGAPLLPGTQASEDKNWSVSTSSISGYSILQGENIEEVKAIFNDHPHLAAQNGSEVEIRPFMSMQ
ncbi:MAG: hypothetical protein ACPG4Z_03650 [Chitinophagales bacterium]